MEELFSIGARQKTVLEQTKKVIISTFYASVVCSELHFRDQVVGCLMVCKIMELTASTGWIAVKVCKHVVICI